MTVAALVYREAFPDNAIPPSAAARGSLAGTSAPSDLRHQSIDLVSAARPRFPVPSNGTLQPTILTRAQYGARRALYSDGGSIVPYCHPGSLSAVVSHMGLRAMRLIDGSEASRVSASLRRLVCETVLADDIGEVSNAQRLACLLRLRTSTYRFGRRQALT